MGLTTEDMKNTAGVLVVVGSGGVGLAIARRMGSGHHIVLADFSEKQLELSAQALREEGQVVDTVRTDVASMESVQNLVQHVTKLGPIRAIAHTAGLSPVQASADQIYQVDLLGAAQVIEEFYPHVTHGTAMVVIASIAGHGKHSVISPELEKHLAIAPSSELLLRPEFDTSTHNSDDPIKDYLGRMKAYSVSKRANIVRVQAAASAWGIKGARINSVSPGAIATAIGRQEIDGPIGGSAIKEAIARIPAKRIGSPIEIANVVAFLSSPESSFITGNDIIVDGGWVSSDKWADATSIAER
jgi:NAD(P)-dependent dehydrogenase (short-subunit alcohol dehydrogenase family)